jgi:hypothetical protein
MTKNICKGSIRHISKVALKINSRESHLNAIMLVYVFYIKFRQNLSHNSKYMSIRQS